MTQLADQLTGLGLRYTAGALDDLVALATKKRFSQDQATPDNWRSLEERGRMAVLGAFWSDGYVGAPTGCSQRDLDPLQ